MAYILKETVRGVSAVAIDDELMTEERILFFVGECNDDSCNMLLKELMYLEHVSHDEITLFINSPGGSVSSGLAVIDYIENMESPVKTVVSGIAASMGGLLFLAGETRLMYEHSRIMLHAPSYGNRDISGMKPAEIQNDLNELNKIRDITDTIIRQRTGMSAKKVCSITDQDTWFSANEAIKSGLCTGLISSKKGEN